MAKKEQNQPKRHRFLVPSELLPGVYRAGIGLIRPGEVLTLPDAASVKGEVPSAKLEPLDEESAVWLQAQLERGAKERTEAAKRQLEEKKEGVYVAPRVKPVVSQAPAPEAPADDTLTVSQLGKVRAADR